MYINQTKQNKKPTKQPPPPHPQKTKEKRNSSGALMLYIDRNDKSAEIKMVFRIIH